MKNIKISLLILLLIIFKANISKAQDTANVIGYIKYENLYDYKLSPFTMNSSYVTVFGKSTSYICYVSNYIKDEIAFAKAICKLTDIKDNDAFEASVNSAKKYNEENLKIVNVGYLINTKNNERKTISHFLYTKEDNCYTIDTLKFKKYEFIDSTKNIMGYNCKKAYLKTAKGEYNIWYSDELPFNVGPLNWFGLPGAILEVDAPILEIGFKAVEISTKDLSKLLIKRIPYKHDNRIVNKEEYSKILAKDNALRNTNLKMKEQKIE